MRPIVPDHLNVAEGTGGSGDLAILRAIVDHNDLRWCRSVSGNACEAQSKQIGSAVRWNYDAQRLCRHESFLCKMIAERVVIASPTLLQGNSAGGRGCPQADASPGGGNLVHLSIFAARTGSQKSGGPTNAPSRCQRPAFEPIACEPAQFGM